MISCMKLYHPTITTLTKCKILRFIFKDYEFEIEVISNHTVIIFIWNVTKSEVWQAFAMFENTKIIAGYGFGSDKAEARLQAEGMVMKLVQALHTKEIHPQVF